MSDDFENVALGNQKLEENDMDGAMHYFHEILKDNKDHIKLYLTNFDLFCKNEITKKKQAASKNGAKVLILINDYLFNRYSKEYAMSDNNLGEKRMSLASKKTNEKTQVLLVSSKNKDFLLHF